MQLSSVSFLQSDKAQFLSRIPAIKAIAIVGHQMGKLF